MLVVFAAPAIPYVTSRLLGDLSSLFLGTVPLIGTLLSLFLYACISALVTGGPFFLWARRGRRIWPWVLALAVCLAAGLDGIEKGMVPPAEITENIFAMDADARKAHGIESLPGSLEEAIWELEGDQLILDTLGEHVAANYLDGKRQEWEEYRTRVSSWEREKYIINY